MTEQQVSDATVSNAADGVFVGVTPPARVGVPAPAPESAAPAEARFTEADLAKVREQEKNKLYPQMQTLQDELKDLRTKLTAREQAEKDAQEQAEREQKAKKEAETDVRDLLAEKEAELLAQIEAERQERQKAVSLLEKERELAALSDYRSQKIAAVGDDIIPELRDLVSGETPDQIDASIAGLIDRSSRILEGAQAAMQSARQQMQGTKVTSPPTELDTNMGNKEFTPEEIAAMPMAEYQKHRARLLGQTGGSNRGMFG